jgi:hypothetical protein
MNSKMGITVIVASFISAAIMMALPANEHNLDGNWWTSVDEERQLGFVHGYVDCYCHINPGPEGFNNVSMEGIRKKITQYYKNPGSDIHTPVITVLKAAGVSHISGAGEATESATFRLFDSEYWRQGTGEFRLGFVEGYFSCLASKPKMRARFPKAPQYYVARVSDWYGIKEDDPGYIDPKRVDEPIARVLFKFAEKP